MYLIIFKFTSFSQALKAYAIHHYILPQTIANYDVICLVAQMKKHNKSCSNKNEKTIILIHDSQIETSGIDDYDQIIGLDLPPLKGYWPKRIFLMHKFISQPANIDFHQIITDTDHVAHLESLMDFLERCNLKEVETFNLIKKQLLKIHDDNFSKLFCNFMKIFGHCAHKNSCLYRHAFKKTDFEATHCQLLINPEREYKMIKGNVSHLVTPNFLYLQPSDLCISDSNVINLRADSMELNSAMAEFFATPQNCLQINSINSLKLNALYAYKAPGNYFSRVKVCEFHPRRSAADTDKVTCFFIDFGRREVLSAHDLYHLPADLASMKHLALEIVLCNVLPIDKTNEWSPASVEKASQLLMNKFITIYPLLITSTTIFCSSIEDSVLLQEFDQRVQNFVLPQTYFDWKIATRIDDHLKTLMHLKAQLDDVFKAQISESKSLNDSNDSGVQPIPWQYYSNGEKPDQVSSKIKTNLDSNFEKLNNCKDSNQTNGSSLESSGEQKFQKSKNDSLISNNINEYSCPEGNGNSENSPNRASICFFQYQS